MQCLEAAALRGGDHCSAAPAARAALKQLTLDGVWRALAAARAAGSDVQRGETAAVARKVGNKLCTWAMQLLQQPDATTRTCIHPACVSSDGQPTM